MEKHDFPTVISVKTQEFYANWRFFLEVNSVIFD
jgi:hypothetical protein